MSYSCKTQHQKPVIIRNPKSGFVLDACEYHVKIQHYSGSPSQKWTLQCLNQGKFMIINVGNGKALDIDNGAKICAKLITFHKHGKTNQQWYVNADGTLQCPVDNLVLDIVNGKYYPGNNIIAFPKHGRENQKFQLQPEYTNIDDTASNLTKLTITHTTKVRRFREKSMSYGFQPPPPYQPGAPPYQPGAPPYQPGATLQSGFPSGAPPPYQGGQCAVIRNTPSGLCLDATEYEVKLQHYTGSPAQQWILEPVGGDRYVLRNKGNGAVLDIEGGPDCGANLITYESHGGPNQQWFVNPDHTITSGAANLAVDVCDGQCFPGNILIAYDRHGGPNQQFHLEYH